MYQLYECKTKSYIKGAVGTWQQIWELAEVARAKQPKGQWIVRPNPKG